VIVVIATGSSGSDPDPKETPNELAFLDGIPQDGAWLGDPDAPVVLEEYADLQCPFCQQFALNNLEPIVKDFVKTGEVRIRLRMVSILGPDSETAAQFWNATQKQNRAWQFAEAFYIHQKPENSGYVNDDFLRARAKDAGVDADQAFTDQKSATVTSARQADTKAFDDAKLDGTPAFRMGPKDGELRTVEAADVATELQKDVEKAQGT
jgi:protein-disulfide isomerase